MAGVRGSVRGGAGSGRLLIPTATGLRPQKEEPPREETEQEASKDEEPEDKEATLEQLPENETSRYMVDLEKPGLSKYYEQPKDYEQPRPRVPTQSL